MDLRKTLISVLWILLLKLEEDCNAEEGMWMFVLVPKPVSAAGMLIDRQMSAAEIVWQFALVM